MSIAPRLNKSTQLAALLIKQAIYGYVKISGCINTLVRMKKKSSCEHIFTPISFIRRPRTVLVSIFSPMGKSIIIKLLRFQVLCRKHE